MFSDDGSLRIYDIKNFFKLYLGLTVLLIVMYFAGIDGSLLFYGIILSFIYIFYFFSFQNINIKFDLYKDAKEELMIFIFISLGLSGATVFLLKSLMETDGERPYLYTEIGFIFFFISLALYFFTKDKYVLKKAEDFDGYLVQERMYDDIDIQLEDAFKYRLINGEKEVYATDVDNEVVDIFQNIKPEIFVEIRDFILMNEAGRNFCEYWLTILDVENQNEIDEYIAFLNKKVEHGDEEDKFYRYMFQLINKKLDSVGKNYDFTAALKKFSGVVEYAIIDMYIYASNYKNIPMGNILAYAVENKQSRHFYGTLNSLSFKSVGRYGIGIYVGYFLAKDHLEEVENQKS